VKLGFLSDAHGNREAFDLGILVLRSRGAETIYFLGDAVGYMPGDAVLDAIREAETIPILGNHDAALLAREIDPDREDVIRLQQTLQTASAANLEFVASWPDHRVIESPSGTILLVHGSPANRLDGYIYPDTDLKPISDLGAHYVFLGHTHRPFVRRGEHATFVNVGSCGLPRDCGHLGAVSLFDTETGDVEILRFDIQDATRAALRRCGPVSPQVLAVFERRSSSDCYGA